MYPKEEYKIGIWYTWYGTDDIPPVDDTVHIWVRFRNGKVRYTIKPSSYSWKLAPGTVSNDYEIVSFMIASDEERGEIPISISVCEAVKDLVDELETMCEISESLESFNKSEIAQLVIEETKLKIVKYRHFLAKLGK